MVESASQYKYNYKYTYKYKYIYIDHSNIFLARLAVLSVSHTVLIKVPDGQIEMPDGLLDFLRPSGISNVKSESKLMKSMIV